MQVMTEGLEGFFLASSPLLHAYAALEARADWPGGQQKDRAGSCKWAARLCMRVVLKLVANGVQSPKVSLSPFPCPEEQLCTRVLMHACAIW